MTCDPQTLARVSRCFCFLPKKEIRAATIYLLCTWANAPTCDPDALTFLQAAGIDSDSTEGVAVCALVAALKAYPEASPEGSKYWDREKVIYPFVGGTAASHSINLKSPGGPNNLTYGGGVVHGPFGGKGNNAANSWANTGYVNAAPISQNSSRVFMYLDTDATLGGRFYFGAFSGAPAAWLRWARDTTGTGPVVGGINNLASNHPYGTTSKIGAWLFQRQTATHEQVAYQTIALPSPGFASASSAFPSSTMGIWTVNINSVPDGTACCNAGISGWSFGTPFANDTEWQEYRGIWEAFQTALGRKRP